MRTIADDRKIKERNDKEPEKEAGANDDHSAMGDQLGTQQSIKRRGKERGNLSHRDKSRRKTPVQDEE